MIKMTVLYSYDKAVAKLSKVHGVSKQVVKDHFDDMNVELFYQTRKAFGREYTHWMIEQSDIEVCRQWLSTHSEKLAKDEARSIRNSNGYVLDNHKDESLHFNTQREIADFLGYKNVGFVIGKVYRGYELKRETTSEESSVPENNSIVNTNNGESITNHTIANDNTSVDIADITNFPEHQPFVLGDLDSEPKQETKPKSNPEPKQETKPMSDFESKLDAYIEKYYSNLE